jgi:hypothetical protein
LVIAFVLIGNVLEHGARIVLRYFVLPNAGFPDGELWDETRNFE